MKNISSRFVFVVEPYIKFWEEEEESVSLSIKVTKNGVEYGRHERIKLDFMKSNYDAIFDRAKELIRKEIEKARNNNNH